MILSRRKIHTPKTLKNGVWRVQISSITESLVEGKNVVILNFTCEYGQASLIMPIDVKLHSLLCDMMAYLNIEKYAGLDQFVGGWLMIEIVKNKVKYISKTQPKSI